MASRPLLAVCCLASAILVAGVLRGGEYRVPLMTKAPVLDGRVEPAEWARSAGFAGFAFRGMLERRRVSARVGATATHIFVAFRSQLPAEGELTAKVQKDTVKLVYDDSVEVWIDPTPGAEHGQTYQMLANPLGRVGYKHHARGRERERPAWRGNWKVANGMHGGYWHCEVAIPVADVAPGRTAGQGAWAINLCRNWKQPWAFSSLGGGSYAPEGIRFVFAPDALAIVHSIDGHPTAGDLKMALALTNPTAKPIPIKAAMHLTRDAMPALRADESLTIAPGDTKTLAFNTRDESTQRFDLAIDVASPDGELVHYSRSLKWKAGKPWRWIARKKTVLPIDLQFAYYPYRDTVRVLVDTANLPADAEVERLTIAVRRKGDATPIQKVEFVDGVAFAPTAPTVRLVVDDKRLAALGLKPIDLMSLRLKLIREDCELPLDSMARGRALTDLLGRLADETIAKRGRPAVPLREVAELVVGAGEDRFRRRGTQYPVMLHVKLPREAAKYEVAVRAQGKNVPEGEFVKAFERRVFEWERKGLGTSTKVFPPFTPIAREGARISTVLREHTMNTSGLWDQVVAKGQPLLAQPMRWVPVFGGEELPTNALPLIYEPGSPHKQVVHARWVVGPMATETRCTWDYDGLMRVRLKLFPTLGIPLEALRLEVPLRARHATMIHAMGDGIRNTVYTRVPEGEGVVWNSSKVQGNDFPANFCSYIYVGTPVRGICWVAENDSGWSLDPAKPNVDIVRRGDQVVLRVHLVNKPVFDKKVRADRVRTITFGLQAAPVKPRIANWRYIWRRENYTLLGTDINWLARGNCGSVYPAGKDMFLWEMIKRGNREKLSREEVQKVIERGRKYFEPYGPEYVERYTRHVPHNLLSRHGKKMVFYYNRASCQLFPEFQTFQDEWCLSDYRTVGKGNGIGEIKIVPTASYIDHALWWYGKSFDVAGNQGVYWDNYYFRGSFNTGMTAAYRKPDGSTVPSNGIWGLRELAKRTFVYMNERGMRPITMVHMTSTGILPVYSFCTVQYDWEWKYSQGDVQYRFPRDYILLVTTGELAGAWPVLLGDHGKLARDEWTQRTFAGVCLVHELDGWGGGKAWRSLFKHVHRLVETPGIDVFRYWDDRAQPVVASHPDLPTIVYSLKGKEALVAVTSYAEKDVKATLTIDPGPLGLKGGYRVVDAETNEPVAAKGNEVSFPLKKHDVRAFRLLAR